MSRPLDHDLRRHVGRMLAENLGGDPRARARHHLRRAGDQGAPAARALRRRPRSRRSADRAPGRPRLVGVDARELLHAEGRRGARRRPQLRVTAVRLRRQRSGSARLGRRPPSCRSGLALGDDHDVRAAERLELHPVREHARFLGAERLDRARPSMRTASTSGRRRTATSSSSPTSSTRSQPSSGSPSAARPCSSSRPTSTSPNGS